MTQISPTLETRTVSSLVKIFADESVKHPAHEAGSALRGEVFSFQVAYRSATLASGVAVTVESEVSAWITVRSVGLVPSELPWRDSHDGNVLRTTPGLYPDPLYEIPTEGITVFPEQWRSIWVTVRVPEDAGAGVRTIGVRFATSEGELLGRASFDLDVIPATLPRQQLTCTQWFHTDCLATYYDLEIWGEDHWQRIEQFVSAAVDHGITMILTPLFTPPLDTAIGGERPTVQLVDVWKEAGGYRFGFNRLERWVAMCDRLGVRVIEFSHLFTQWGARHCPKIVATTRNGHEAIFGWHTDAGSQEYREFLDAFLPALIGFIDDHGLRERCMFHVSDEPRLGDLDHYRSAAALLRRHLADFPILDALSDYDFYAEGSVGIPVPASNHIEPFLEHNVRPLWTYYCVSQREKVSNRFFAMPSARNRILGMQLFKFDAAGFLHWGYNFWYSQYSVRPIDPFTTTDAGHAFPSGDAFLVYPGEHGPIDSLRFEVFREALQDVRALRLLGDRIGHDAVVALLEDGLEKPLSFSEYPHSAEWLLEKREMINRRLGEAVG